MDTTLALGHSARVTCRLDGNKTSEFVIFSGVFLACADAKTLGRAEPYSWTEVPEAIEQRTERTLSSWSGPGIGQLSSRTLTVSTCCWNVATFPPAKVKTWAIFTLAGAPELLCFQL